MFTWLAALEARLPLISTCKRYVLAYRVPKNLNIFYCFGLLALVVLANQLLTGFWLTMFYTPTAADAFNSIEYIMRDVHFGWLFRYMHTTGASAFFIVLYLHLFRGLLYGSYQKPRELVWLFGMLLLTCIFTEAILGYILPWGQMSYWGTQVLTSLFGVIPYIGDSLVTWIRGDFVVGNATLQRFYALHLILIPFFIIVLTCLHIAALHYVGSNNPDGIEVSRLRDKQGVPLDVVPFCPAFLLKDCLVVLVFLIIFFSVVFFVPDMHGYFLEPTNLAPANRMQTPDAIRPIWYMAPFYAMLRVIPNKTLGVLTVFAAFFVLFFLPWLDKSPVKSMRYKGCYSNWALRFLIVSFCLLGYLGVSELTMARQYLARVAMFVYFGYFLLMPIYTRLEQCKPVPDRIGL